MTKGTKKNIEGESDNLVASSQPAEFGPDMASAEEAFSKLLQLVRTVQAGMQNIEGSHGLSGSQLWALWQISAQPGLRVTKLAEAQHIHPSTASNLLDKLESRGLVRRERNDTDSRVVRLYLTDPGLELAKSIPGPMQGRLRSALREVPAPVLEGLLKGLTSVLDIMSESPR
ncbi:MarR family transcriptional regulator [Sulfuricella denitrificans skB26]|uniref:MarR family transcriptional regulator n=1 Tax=Sulfuricella denitrificans (strain DSM 22764 / NBRC 105220 / skB26) TaxID=1163617 RepID=S6AD72_SULDS|nr:MarR family transcriptional regulator [Sulfuricella denitrificans]BAN36233.1 MarR family transcriptional regulator [Sulfuricella denitrificans skB26]